MAAKKGNKYAKGNKGGRPPKYNAKYCKEVVIFFSGPPFRRENTSEVKGFNKSGKQNFEKKEYKLVANELPTLIRFARKIGVTVQTLHNWAAEHKEFFDALMEAKELYTDFLTQNGLLGLYDSRFAQFIAINTTGLKQKPNDGGNDDDKPIINVIVYHAKDNNPAQLRPEPEALPAGDSQEQSEIQVLTYSSESGENSAGSESSEPESIDG